MKCRNPVWFDFATEGKDDLETEWIHYHNLSVVPIAEESNVIAVGHVVCLNARMHLTEFR